MHRIEEMMWWVTLMMQGCTEREQLKACLGYVAIGHGYGPAISSEVLELFSFSRLGVAVLISSCLFPF